VYQKKVFAIRAHKNSKKNAIYQIMIPIIYIFLKLKLKLKTMQTIKSFFWIVCCYLMLPATGVAQNNTLQPTRCGSTDFAGGIEGLDAWAKAYYAQPQKTVTSLPILYLPVHLSLVSNSDRTGRISPNFALSLLCKVNNDYRPYGIQFWLDSLDVSIQNTAFNNPASASTQAIGPMLVGHQMANRFNIYLHSGETQTFAAGVYLGTAHYPNNNITAPDVINCFASSLTTSQNIITHTIGHYLGLPHTFSGTEGYDNPACTTPPTQATVGAPFNDPNCTTNGDRFCDTPPDYHWNNWNCGAGDATLGNTGNHWSCPIVSPDGVTMQVDGSNLMSHALGLCGNHFSNNQRDRMRDLITTLRSSLLAVPVVGDTISQPVTMVSPLTFAPSAPIELKWRKVPNATRYIVEVFGNSVGSQVLMDSIVTDTMFTYQRTNLSKLNYWIKIKPFNKKYFCTAATPSRFSVVTGTENYISDLSTMEIVPNPVASASFSLHTNTEKDITTSLVLIDLTGRVVKNFGIQQFSAGDSQRDMDINEVPNGIYFIKMQNETGISTRKMVVLK
jgi:hypothetical protein